jgi:hypothetical protein
MAMHAQLIALDNPQGTLLIVFHFQSMLWVFPRNKPD